MYRDRHFDADRLRARGLLVLSAANRRWTAQVLCGNSPHGVFLQRPVCKEEDSAGPSPTLGGTYQSSTMFWNLGYSTDVLTWKRGGWRAVMEAYCLSPRLSRNFFITDRLVLAVGRVGPPSF